jgi:hypothetical protein
METTPENRKIEIGQETLKHLNTTRKWAMFIAIIGFIFLGLIILIGALAGTFLSAFNSGETGLGISDLYIFVILMFLAAVYFLPLFFLFRFSKYTSLALQTLDKKEFHKAINNLKSYFVYLGTLIIIVIILYFVVLVISGTSMAVLKEMG